MKFDNVVGTFSSFSFDMETLSLLSKKEEYYGRLKVIQDGNELSRKSE